uniref:chlorophyll(ide) b reductase n=1 Tax=Oryza glumipatula TaxID=40148 RepID=A0A0D9ZB76_9ORYZ
MAATAAYLPLRAQAQVGLAPLRPSGSAAAGARLPGRTARRRLAARGGPEAAGIRAEAVPGGGGVARRAAMVPPYNVLITGSTKGIGYALAKEFLKAGDNVVICSRSAERVESAVTDLKKEFGEQHVWGIVCDVREGKDVKALVDFARDKMKYIDIWINNAGSNAYSYKPLVETSDEALMEVITTNTLGLMICCREAINMMRNQPRGGHIFNIDGAGSDGRPTPRFAAYGATKRSVVHLTKSLQAELQMNEVNNVMVHNLSPGMVTTDLLMSGATTKQVADYLVPNIRAIPTNQSMKPTYIRFLTGLKAYSRIFSRIAFGARRNKIMSNSQPAQEDDCMSSILVSRLIRAMQPTRSYLRWSDDLHKMFVEAVAYHGGPYEAKPTAVKETMQAMGVTGLTTHNIKSHLQKYRESFSSGVGSLHDHDLLRTTSPSKEALDLASEMVRDNDAAMAEIEMLNDLLLDHDIEMMERELMSEIKLIEHNFEISESALDEYMDDLANYAFDLTGPANSSSP